MSSTPRGNRLAAVFTGTALLAACGSGSDAGRATETAAAGTEAPTTGAAGAAAGGMTLTIKLNPDAVWDDGSPITSADLECGWRANLNTPGSIATAGYEKITGIDTSDPKVAVVTFSEPYAAYKTLFSGAASAGVIKADSVANCDDISADFLDSIPFSGRPFKQESWSTNQTVLVPNENYWVDEDKPIASRVVIVPKLDQATELISLRSGEVGAILPQAFAGITDALDDPAIEFSPGYGSSYEDLFFQVLNGPLADPVFREAFSKSVDRNLILKSIYDPIFPGSPLLQCGLWVPTVGPWCDNTQFENSYDPTAAQKLLTDNGWTKSADDFWAKDGTVPTIRWVTSTGNKRREDTQALMIPQLAGHGFKVVTDNADPATVFQKRLPALDYDLTMLITSATADPSVTWAMSCDQIPTAANSFQGANSSGWCNEEASELMKQSDAELDESKRADLIHQIGRYLVDDSVLLPLYQFPAIIAWRTDQLTGPIDEYAGNPRTAFHNLNKWEPVGKDEIVIGAEQWPDCLNPVTECAGSTWMALIAGIQLFPAVWDPTADGFATTALVTEEPTVEVG